MINSYNMITTILFDFNDTLAIANQEVYMPKYKILALGVTEEEYNKLLNFEKNNAGKYLSFEASKNVKTVEEEYLWQKKFYTLMANESNLKNSEEFINFILDYRLNQIEFVLYPEVEEMIKKLSNKYTLCFLTNALPSRERELKSCPIFKYFKKYYISNFLGLAKPDKKYYQYVLDDLGIKASEALFLDDKESLVKAASDMGINTVIIDRKQTYLSTSFNRLDSLDGLEEIINKLS